MCVSHAFSRGLRVQMHVWVPENLIMFTANVYITLGIALFTADKKFIEKLGFLCSQIFSATVHNLLYLFTLIQICF